LDLHVYESSGDHIYHGNRVSSRGGRLIRDSSGFNAVEIISYNLINPSSIVIQTFTCQVVCFNCPGSIRFNLTILQGPNNDWHYYSGDLSSTSYQKTVATFSVATPITTPTTTASSRFASSFSCTATRIFPHISMYISRRNKKQFF
jgi:hypothetical protein